MVVMEIRHPRVDCFKIQDVTNRNQGQRTAKINQTHHNSEGYGQPVRGDPLPHEGNRNRRRGHHKTHAKEKGIDYRHVAILDVQNPQAHDQTKATGSDQELDLS